MDGIDTYAMVSNEAFVSIKYALHITSTYKTFAASFLHLRETFVQCARSRMSQSMQASSTADDSQLA